MPNMLFASGTATQLVWLGQWSQFKAQRSPVEQLSVTSPTLCFSPVVFPRGKHAVDLPLFADQDMDGL